MAAPDICTALFAARQEMKDPRLVGDNPHFRSKFVPRDEVLDSILPALAGEGLFLAQGIFSDVQGASLVTTVYDKAGEWLELCRYPMQPNSDPQKYLAACTYASRGSLMLAFALAGDPDDDGNTAAQPVPGVTKAQLDEMKKLAKDKGMEAQAVSELIVWHTSKGKASELTKDEANTVIAAMKEASGE